MSGPSTELTETVARVPGPTVIFCTMSIPLGFRKVSLMTAAWLFGLSMESHSSKEPSVAFKRVVPSAK